MPIFTFKSPEGKEYDVTAPEGATQDQAFQILQSHLAGNQPMQDMQTSIGADGLPTSGEEVFYPDAPPVEAPVAPQETTLGEDIVGVGEAALTGLTGAIGGLAGQAGGALKGIAEAILRGDFGTPQAAKLTEESAMKGAQSLTYQPRTPAGVEMAKVLGTIGEALTPIAPLGAEIGAAIRMASQGVKAAKKAPASPSMEAAAESASGQAPKSAEEIGNLVRKAADGGIGSSKARAELAKEIKVNPEAAQAVDRLNIDVPVDVLSDSELVKSAAGLPRGVAASEAESAWRESVINASKKADEAIESLDATTDVASVSENILDSLRNTQSKLKKDAGLIYDKVDQSLPKTAKVDMPNLRSVMDSIKSEAGDSGLTPKEKALIDMLDSGDVTYGRLMREKSSIGDTIGRKSTAYGDVDSATLKRIYGAIAEDQLAAVGQIGGEELRSQLRVANHLTAKRKALESRIVNSFGKDFEGSIVPVMRQAITQGSKGDITKLNKLLRVVPEDLQKDVVASSLMSATRGAGAQTGERFGFSQYAKAYRGLRNNTPVYNKIVDVLGKDMGKDKANQILTDLYIVSKRISDAESRVMKTGKANQALANSLMADGVMESIANSTIGRAAAVTAGAKLGGGVGAGAMAWIIDLLTKGRKNKLESVGNMFKSDEFASLVTEIAEKGTASEETVKKLSMSKPFQKWAKQANIPAKQAEAWINETIAASQ